MIDQIMLLKKYNGTPIDISEFFMVLYLLLQGTEKTILPLYTSFIFSFLLIMILSFSFFFSSSCSIFFALPQSIAEVRRWVASFTNMKFGETRLLLLENLFHKFATPFHPFHYSFSLVFSFSFSSSFCFALPQSVAVARTRVARRTNPRPA